jgi:hypothetical protein
VRWLDALVGIADDPSDDDDLRLRKRVGVAAGYIIIIGALQLPILARGLPLSWAVAVALPVVNAANLVVLARTHRFDRYVAILAASVLLFPVVIEVALGGLNGASAAIVFAFLAPVLGMPGRVQVAQTTERLLRDRYAFDEREPIEVKGLGTMITYVLAEDSTGT